MNPHILDAGAVEREYQHIAAQRVMEEARSRGGGIIVDDVEDDY
jgi:hypothetical protein